MHSDQGCGWVLGTQWADDGTRVLGTISIVLQTRDSALERQDLTASALVSSTFVVCAQTLYCKHSGNTQKKQPRSQHL